MTADDESVTSVARLLFPLQVPQASASIPDSSTLSQPTVYIVCITKYNSGTFTAYNMLLCTYVLLWYT